MRFRDQQHSSLKSPRGFATTRWSVVVSAGRSSSPDSQQALAALCETYWLPLYGYVRRQVNDVAEAQDLTQAFFTELLEKNFVGSATPDRGRFRSFLLASLKHFLSKERDKARAQKRGGGRILMSLNFERADSQLTIEPVFGLTADQQYDRQWAVTLLSHIMERLQSEFEGSGKGKHFRELKPFLIGDHACVSYASVADRLGMTEAAAKMAGSRLRKRYRELLREEIAQTVAVPEEVEDEIRKLFVTLKL